MAITVVWELDLFVVGETPRTQIVYDNLKQLLNASNIKYKINLIDLMKQPKLAHDNQIVSTPTTIRRKPLPPITLVGDLCNTAKVLSRLSLK